MLIEKWLTTFGKYLILMGRSFSRPERMRMFLKQYIKEKVLPPPAMVMTIV